MVTGVETATAVVTIVNIADVVDPAATVTEAGAVAIAGLLLDNVTSAPPAGAAADNVTRFNVVLDPPVTVAGDSVNPLMATGRTVSVSVLLTPL
jgi:hypothetical protein